MKESFFRIIALIRKELLAMFKDPKSRIVLVLPPILQCLIFGYAASYDLNNVPYAVLDHDHSAASIELVSKLDGSGIFSRVATLQRTSDIDKFINDARVLLVVVIDQDFERRLMAGMPAKLQIIADGRNSNTAGTAQSYINTIATDFTARWREENGQERNNGIKVTTRAWYNPSLETRWYMIPSLIGTITMMMTLMLTAMSVAREREAGTFDQLLVTPFRPSEIMVGKALPSMLVGLSQATTILLVAQLWFQIPFEGSYFMLYLGLVLFLAAAVRHWPFHLFARRQHAAGNDLLVRAADAIHAAVGSDGADRQYAGDPAVSDNDQSAALCDQHYTPGLSGGRRPEAIAAGNACAGGHRRGYPAIFGLAVPQQTDLMHQAEFEG